MAKRRSSSGYKFHTTAPKHNTAIISIIIFVLGLIGWVVWISFLSPISVWLFIIAYVILLAGVLMKDL
jgi:uncharacterized protein (DUF983 family)